MRVQEGQTLHFKPGPVTPTGRLPAPAVGQGNTVKGTGNISKPMKRIYVAIVAVIIAVGIIGGAVTSMLEGDHARTNDNDIMVRGIVIDSVEMYKNGILTFDDITNSAQDRPPGHTYLFVADLNTEQIVAHGANPDLVGSISVSLTRSEKPFVQIVHELETDGSTWTQYLFEDPDTGQEKYKTAFLYLHDGYVFGAGYYQ